MEGKKTLYGLSIYFTSNDFSSATKILMALKSTRVSFTKKLSRKSYD